MPYADKEKQLAYQDAWNKRNPEKVNSDRKRAYNRARYHRLKMVPKIREKKLAWHRAHREKNKERLQRDATLAYYRKKYGEFYQAAMTIQKLREELIKEGIYYGRTSYQIIAKFRRAERTAMGNSHRRKN